MSSLIILFVPIDKELIIQELNLSQLTRYKIFKRMWDITITFCVYMEITCSQGLLGSSNFSSGDGFKLSGRGFAIFFQKKVGVQNLYLLSGVGLLLTLLDVKGIALQNLIMVMQVIHNINHLCYGILIVVLGVIVG